MATCAPKKKKKTTKKKPAKKKNPDSTFLRSLIHATDSTCRGCTAQSSAVMQAGPGLRPSRIKKA